VLLLFSLRWLFGGCQVRGDVAEIAALYGCHRNTVRHWLAIGLKPIDDRRPALVLGAVLNAFHGARRANAKVPCGPGELYCAPCRKARAPAAGVADIVEINAKIWKITAICPQCSSLMVQRVGTLRLTEFQAFVDLSETRRL